MRRREERWKLGRLLGGSGTIYSGPEDFKRDSRQQTSVYARRSTDPEGGGREQEELVIKFEGSRSSCLIDEKKKK